MEYKKNISRLSWVLGISVLVATVIGVTTCNPDKESLPEEIEELLKDSMVRVNDTISITAEIFRAQIYELENMRKEFEEKYEFKIVFRDSLKTENKKLTYAPGNIERNLEDLKKLETKLWRYPPEFLKTVGIEEICFKDSISVKTIRDTITRTTIGNYNNSDKRINFLSGSKINIEHEIGHLLYSSMERLGIDMLLLEKEWGDFSYVGEEWDESDSLESGKKTAYCGKNFKEHFSVTVELGSFRNLLEKAKSDTLLQKQVIRITGCLWDFESMYPISFLSEGEYVERFGAVGDYEGYLFYPLVSRDKFGNVQMGLQYWKDFIDLKGEIPKDYWNNRIKYGTSRVDKKTARVVFYK